MSSVPSRGRSTFLLVALPLFLAAATTLLLSIQLSTHSNQKTYNELTQRQLQNNLQIVRSLINFSSNTSIPDLEKSLRTLPFQPGHGIALVHQSGEVLLNIGPAETQGLRREIFPYLTFHNSAIHTFSTANNMPIAVVRNGDTYVTAYSRTSPEANHWILWIQFSILGALLFLALMITLYTAVTNPLSHMTRSLSSILNRRRYDLRLPVTGSAELRALSAAFNNLLEAVQHRDGQLREHTQKLEQLVRARTAELEATHTELLRREKMAAIGAFAAATVHELRNPLTAMRLSLDPLQKLDNLDAKSRRRLALVHEESVRLESMLNDILTYAANRPAQNSEVNIDGFIKKYKPLFRDTAQAQKAKLLIKHEQGMLVADENRLHQILLNLVKNAADASDSVRLTIEQKKDRWHFSVSNKGHIEPTAAARLFEPFFTTKKDGTGLGLSTCKKLAEDMGGTLVLATNDGKTVTFTLSL